MARRVELPRRSPPVRIVAIGGGTGLSNLLRGLAAFGSEVEATAIVAVSDDGGSSGRLRKVLGVPALGDARACLAALSSREDWARMLEYRFRRGALLRGHALGNLLLAAAHKESGSLSGALEQVARLVGARGRVLPATNAAPTLVATLADGREVEGESVLSSVVGPILKLRLLPDVVPPAPGVLEAIAAADLIALGPGSLFTSIIAAALAGGIPRALGETRVPKVLVQNLTTQRGETDDLGVVEHARAVLAHLGPRSLDAVLVHEWNGLPPPEGIIPDTAGLASLGLEEIRDRLATERGRGRLHDPHRVAAALLRHARRHERGGHLAAT